MAEHAKNTTAAARTKYARTVPTSSERTAKKVSTEISISLSKLPFFSACFSSVNAWLSSQPSDTLEKQYRAVSFIANCR